MRVGKTGRMGISTISQCVKKTWTISLGVFTDDAHF
jgi:hypothetical protein